jgi:hypothetical protein
MRQAAAEATTLGRRRAFRLGVGAAAGAWLRATAAACNAEPETPPFARSRIGGRPRRTAATATGSADHAPPPSPRLARCCLPRLRRIQAFRRAGRAGGHRHLLIDLEGTV